MAARERKFFVGGNWKMNGSKTSIDGIVEFLKTGPLSQDSGTWHADHRSMITFYDPAISGLAARANVRVSRPVYVYKAFSHAR